MNQHPVNRIVGESCGVVRVRVTARDGVHALREHRSKFVNYAVAVPVVVDRRGEPVEKTEPLVGRPQKHRPGVRGDRRFVENELRGFIEEVWKNHTLCCILCRHVGAS